MATINLKLKTYDELTFEITRLNTEKYLLEQKLQQKENIIKEVREYIEKNLLKDDNGCGCWWYGFGDYNEAKYELLEILDKENKQ